MECPKCGGEMKPLFTSYYCPRCDSERSVDCDHIHSLDQVSSFAEEPISWVTQGCPTCRSPVSFQSGHRYGSNCVVCPACGCTFVPIDIK